MLFFFFSSRRRHTRCSRDWSSDVCSSDLVGPGVHQRPDRLIAVEVRDGDLQFIGGCFSPDTRHPNPVLAHLTRSEEHTSELQSRLHLVCRLLLEKKKQQSSTQYNIHHIWI